MGYGGEHILIGGRLFPILSSLPNADFKIIGLRLDVHERSSIPSKKYNVDQKFIDTLFHIDKLKKIEDLGELKVNLDNPLKDDRQAKNTHHGHPIHSKKLQIRRADSDSFSLSASTSDTSIDSNDLDNVDPSDPNVLYPAYYVASPDFIPRSPNSISSEEDDDCTTRCINGMPTDFRD